MLMLHSQRRAGLLITPKYRLLFFQRRSVPKFHPKLNQPHRLVAAADSPRRLLLICRCIDSREVRKKPGGHWIIRDLAGLDLVGLASL